MEITLYALFIVLIVALVIVRKREVQRRTEVHYLRAYFDIMELPLDVRCEKLKKWEGEAIKRAYPKAIGEVRSSEDNIVTVEFRGT